MNDLIKSVEDKFNGVVSATSSVANLFGSVLNKFSPLEGASVVQSNLTPEQEKQLALDRKVKMIREAIANNETGGVKGDRYKFQKFSGNKDMGNDMGLYQVTGGELKSWSKDFLKRTITPKQFMEDPSLQETYMINKIKALLKSRATPQEIFAMHRGGLTGYADPKIRARKVKERQQYVNKAMDFYDKLSNIDSSNNKQS